MNCCIGNCDRRATVMVTFAHTSKPYAYCDRHAYRRGRAVWHPKDVRTVERVSG